MSSDRTLLKLIFIVILVAIALAANADMAKPGYQLPPRLLKMLVWQRDEANRSLALRRGLDLQGGLQVLMQAGTGAPFTRDDLNTARTIIQNRVDSLGVTEALVHIQGDDKIVVELPGIDDPDLAVRTIGTTAALEFIYGGDQPLGSAQAVSTTFPATWPDIPEDQRDIRLMELSELRALRGRAGSGSGEKAGSSDTVTGTVAAGTSAAGGQAATSGTGTADSAASAESTNADDAEATTTTEAEDATATSDGTAAATSDGTAAASTSPTATENAATDTATTNEGGPTGLQDGDSVRVYPTILSGERIKSAIPKLDELNRWVVSFTLDGTGGKVLSDFTGDHIGKFMPIVLDGKVISSPTIRDRIASTGMISGDFDRQGAEALAIQLRSGALPVSMNVVGRSSIGPTLGQQSVHLAVLGGVVGMIAVIAFMILYYRVPGILASGALLIYVLLSLTVFRLIPVTLTLAGIAGFVLSIGMAVDANVLIFERMKEELRAGRRMTPAIRTGFERAWPSIRDSNLSTLITCVILFWFGSQFGASIVKGFAVTLAVGVLTSVFTAITVSRTFLEATTKYLIRSSATTPPLEDGRLRSLFGF